LSLSPRSTWPARPIWHSKAPPPLPVDPWAGWYVGVNVGGSWGRARDTTTYGAPPVLFASTSSNLDGVIGGGQVGYNWHTSNWLFGLEADIQGSGERGTATSSLFVPGIGCTFAPCGTLGTLVDQEKLPWFGTLRARAGVLAAPSWLFYVTGGLAYGEIDSNETFTVGAASVLANFNNTRAGWTVGGGIEGVVGGNGPRSSNISTWTSARSTTRIRDWACSIRSS